NDFTREHGLPGDAEGRAALVARWHERKTAIYTQMVDEGELPARPGVRRLVEAAEAAGWRVAVASTSARPSVVAVLRHAVGEEAARRVRVFAGDIVPHKKPAPDIYLHALAELGAGAEETVVVEDSGVGLAAAVAAGLRTVVTVSAYTTDDDFSRASLVVDSLGEPGTRTRVLQDPHGIAPGDVIDLDVLERVLAVPGPTGV
ncbi:MAG TPA: HAD-IA family hydrolase, partial [Microbacteriaceae bacterium]|nr:HAD-IA family hydrolase [Microbacteriaceae bacterium]